MTCGGTCEVRAPSMSRSANSAGGLSTFLDFRPTKLTSGRLVAEMETRAEPLTPFGNLRYGCLSAMVDHCLGIVFYPVIPARSRVATTTEFKLNLQPVSNRAPQRSPTIASHKGYGPKGCPMGGSVKSFPSVTTSVARTDGPPGSVEPAAIRSTLHTPTEIGPRNMSRSVRQFVMRI